MKKKIQLLNCVLIFALSCLVQFATAQIIYTDVNPDQTFNTNGGTYNLDLNNDGIIDFVFYHTELTVSCCSESRINVSCTVTPQDENAVVCLPDVIAANSGETISSSSPQWIQYNEKVMAAQFFFCEGFPMNPHCAGSVVQNWSAVTNKYVELKLKVGSDTFYGWARLDVGLEGASFTIKDYAYNSVPGQSILAGQNSITGIISPEKQNDFSVFPNPASDKITLSFSSPEKKQIQITNTLGQIVFTEEINSAKEDIDMSEFPAGMYVVSAQTSSQKIEGKFLKQ